MSRMNSMMLCMIIAYFRQVVSFVKKPPSLSRTDSWVCRSRTRGTVEAHQAWLGRIWRFTCWGQWLSLVSHSDPADSHQGLLAPNFLPFPAMSRLFVLSSLPTVSLKLNYISFFSLYFSFFPTSGGSHYAIQADLELTSLRDPPASTFWPVGLQAIPSGLACCTYTVLFCFVFY
jgi:hypothetical protein